MTEERTTDLQGIVKTSKTYREHFENDEKILRLEVLCSITISDDFPSLVGTDILCKQYFLFPERYEQFATGEKVDVLLPYYRVEDYIREHKPDLQVYNIVSLGPKDIYWGGQHIIIP